MTDPPKILDPPTPPPRMRAVTPVLIAVALILQLLGYATAGLVFVGMALLSSLFDLFGSRLTGGTASPTGTRGPTAGTS